MTLNRMYGQPAHKQLGVVLFFSLIALVALSLAAIALIRSIDTGNVIAGNLAFRQATLQASDHGVEAAFIAMRDTLSNTSNSNVVNQYRATRLDVTTDGVTARTVNWVNDIPWSSIPCRDNSNATVTCSSQSYQIKYFVDRLCGCPGTLSALTAGGVCSIPVTSYQDWCNADINSGKSGSKGQFTASFTAATAIYYRATIQVTGPRNTTTYVQVIFSKG